MSIQELSSQLSQHFKQVSEANKHLPRLSFSAYETYVTCPLKYKFQHVDYSPIKSNQRYAFPGNVVQRAMELWVTQTLQGSAGKDLVSYLEQSWVDSLKDILIEWVSPEDQEQCFVDLRALLPRMQETFFARGLTAPYYLMEVPLALVIDDEFVFRGYADQVNIYSDHLLLIDGKNYTAPDKRAPGQQLLLYQHALQKYFNKPTQCAFWYYRTGFIEPFIFSEEQVQGTLRCFKQVVHLIRDKVFPANPKSSPCNPKFCQYYPVCPGKVTLENMPVPGSGGHYSL